MALLLRAEGQVELATSNGPAERSRFLELVIFDPRGADRLRGKLILRSNMPQPGGVPPFADDSLEFNGTVHGLGEQRAITFSSCIQEGTSKLYFDLLVLNRVPEGDPSGDQLRGRFLRPPQAQRLAALYKRKGSTGAEGLIHPRVALAIQDEIEQVEQRAAQVRMRVPLGAACLSTKWRVGDPTGATEQPRSAQRFSVI